MKWRCVLHWSTKKWGVKSVWMIVHLYVCNILPCTLQCATLSEGELRAVCHPWQSPPGAIGHWSHSALAWQPQRQLSPLSVSGDDTERGNRCQGGDHPQQWRFVENVKTSECTVSMHRASLRLMNFLNFIKQWHFQLSHSLDSRMVSNNSLINES